jgi:hypothetical protein
MVGKKAKTGHKSRLLISRWEFSHGLSLFKVRNDDGGLGQPDFIEDLE